MKDDDYGRRIIQITILLHTPWRRCLMGKFSVISATIAGQALGRLHLVKELSNPVQQLTHPYKGCIVRPKLDGEYGVSDE